MSNLPNPGTMRAAFDTWAEASSATVLAPINRIFVGPLCYEADATGTALTTFGGRNWSPAKKAIATLAHWGVMGALRTPDNRDLLNDPGFSEQGRIVAAVTWTQANGRVLEGDLSRVYGVTGGIWVVASEEQRSAGLRNLNLFVRSWAASMGNMSGDNPDAWDSGTAVLNIGVTNSVLVQNFVLENVQINCNKLAGCGVKIHSVSAPYLDNVQVDRYVNAGFVIGRPRNGSTPTISATDAIMTRCRAREFVYSVDPADGFNDWTVRTGMGVIVGGSDVRINNCAFSGSKIALVLAQGYNIMVSGCAIWGTPTANPLSPPPDYDDRTLVFVSRYACSWSINDCRLEDGRIVVHSALTPSGDTFLPAFWGMINKCKLSQYYRSQLHLVAHESNETASPFIFTGNRVNNDFHITLSTTGTGSWGEYKGELLGNSGASGGAVQGQGKTLINGDFEVHANGILRLPAAAPAPVASTPGGAAELRSGADGKLYYRQGSTWYSVTGVALT